MREIVIDGTSYKPNEIFLAIFSSKTFSTITQNLGLLAIIQDTISESDFKTLLSNNPFPNAKPHHSPLSDLLYSKETNLTPDDRKIISTHIQELIGAEFLTKHLRLVDINELFSNATQTYEFMFLFDILDNLSKEAFYKCQLVRRHWDKINATGDELLIKRANAFIPETAFRPQSAGEQSPHSSTLPRSHSAPSSLRLFGNGPIPTLRRPTPRTPSPLSHSTGGDAEITREERERTLQR